MDNPTFTRTALKTFSNRPAQLGLRRVASNLGRTHLMHAGLGLANEMIETFAVLSPWILGAQQLTPQMQAQSVDELGDVGYFMAILARRLKVKMPGAGKRLRLKGMTPSEALMEMLALSGLIAGLQKKNFYGPEMAGGSIDRVATKAKEDGYNARSAVYLKAFIQLYWQVCTELLKTPPAEVFDKNIAKLAVRFPDGFFSMEKEKSKNPVAESKAQS